jgi:quinol monooxygenase YgiN
MIVRITQSTIDPEEVASAREVFARSMRPAFESFDGCEGIEMYIGIEEHSGDLLELVTISTWRSMQALDAAADSEEYAGVMERVRELFQQSPIVHHFEPVT